MEIHFFKIHSKLIKLQLNLAKTRLNWVKINNLFPSIIRQGKQSLNQDLPTSRHLSYSMLPDLQYLLKIS